MKRYKRFMDGVRAPGTLDQRLKELKTPKKQPAAWAKYGAAAAALILVFGGAALGMHWEARWSGRLDELFRQASYVPENVDEPRPDIAVVEPGETGQPGEKVLEGYDVKEERGGVSVVCHYLLPYIEYTQAGNPNRYTVAADWDIPQGAYKSDMSRKQITWLLGGEDVLSTHLDWDDYELTGWAAWLENGDFWGAYIDGYAGEQDHFTFAVTADQLPPTCFELPDIEEQDVYGVMVTANSYDSAGPDGGAGASTRQVSFMKDGCGFRFDLTGTDKELAEKRVSRLVRQIADDSRTWTGQALGLTVLGNGTYTCEVCGRDYPVGSAHGHPFMGGDTTAPAVSADPSYSAPAVSAESGYTCPTCGETVPAGMSHDCAMCDGYPVPHVCEVCGEAYPAGTEHQCELCRTLTCPDCGASYPAGTDHQCEICGYPLAPDTHVCEVCGQTIPAGVGHSHQQEHHQEQHHSEHH